MPLQAADFFGNLPVSPLDPTGTDSRTISDDQHREIIASLANQAPNWTGAITATHADVNTITGLAAAGTKPMPGVGGLTVLYFYNINTPPPGWTILAPDANIRQLVIGDAAQGGSIGGTGNPVDNTYPLNASLTSAAVGITGNVAGTAITEAQMPPHLHGHDTQNVNYGVFGNNGRGGNVIGGLGGNTSTTGGGAAHDHGSGSLSGTVTNPDSTGTVQITPRYASGILGTLDA